MYVNVLKFHVRIPHENIGDPYLHVFLSELSPVIELFPFYLNNTEKSYTCTVITVMGKQSSDSESGS